MKDLYSSQRANYAVLPIVATNTTQGGNNGTGVDLLNYRGALMIAVLGVEGDKFDTSNYCTIKFQDSPDSSTWSAIADTALVGGNNTQVINNNNQLPIIHQRGYIGSARYVRILFDITGTMANGTPLAGLIVYGAPLHAPIA
jgi:hypothetical protein